MVAATLANGMLAAVNPGSAEAATVDTGRGRPAAGHARVISRSADGDASRGGGRGSYREKFRRRLLESLPDPQGHPGIAELPAARARSAPVPRSGPEQDV
ncbi:hypothetical protein NKH18_40305 [Streptomyces sp. M10(2022)]